MQVQFERFELGPVELNVAMAGDRTRPLVLCLHGFPEYWASWREVMAQLVPDYRLVAPDQRGFNLSSRPEGRDAYRVKHLVADIAALADQLSPGKPFILCGHDWGASVAYAYAFAFPHRVSHLVIANGTHPVCFQKALLADPAQRAASQYFHKLRAEGAATLMTQDNFRRTMNMLAGFSKADWMTPAIGRDYLDAWGQPGAMQAMLHWYSSSPIIVPQPGATVDHAPLLDIDRDRVLVRMPHLVIWGEADEALRPSCLEGLAEYAGDLTIRRTPDAGHWILHERPEFVAQAIREFLDRGC